MVIDWEQHAAHRARIADATGQWVGLLDEEGVPICDLSPVVQLKAPTTRNAASSMELTMVAQAAPGVLHQVMEELVADGLGVVDQEGVLVPLSQSARFACVQRGRRRREFVVSHVVAKGAGHVPETLTVHGASLLAMLNRFPLMSAPLSWTGDFTTFERDWAGPEDVGVLFESPRDLAPVQMVAVADGATVEGPAETVIRRLIVESLQAAYRMAGLDKSSWPLVVDMAESGLSSPRVLVRPTDKPMWDELAPVAAWAGVQVDVSMWWPGDDQPTGHSLDTPTIVVRITQGGQ